MIKQNKWFHRRWIKWSLRSVVLVFVLMNVVAAFHAYKFTHFTDKNVEKTRDASKLSSLEKISTLLFGIDNPKPVNKELPSVPYETVYVGSDNSVECWRIRNNATKGTVILFHGYTGNKSSMLDKGEIFLSLGYDVMLVDFRGSGGSKGMSTTLGYFESEQVKECYDFVRNSGEKKIILFGTSMGAVAVMKAINDYAIEPASIIIECPFGSMYKTVCARFRTMNAPIFPMAGLLVFWGGLENNFWAFGHNPVEYAKNIRCPALLMYGDLDERVSRNEIDQIYANIAGLKELVVFPGAKHENYLSAYKPDWTNQIAKFINLY